MHVTFAPRGILQIDGARITHKNFSGEPGEFNREGDRNFSLVIPNQEIADALMAEKNKFGANWNVKIKPPREEGDSPFMYMSVKVRFNEYGPKIYVQSGHNKILLTEENVSMLDDIEIESCDMDIRPYDGEGRFGPFRSAYLQSMYVVQKVDRFAERFGNA